MWIFILVHVVFDYHHDKIFKVFAKQRWLHAFQVFESAIWKWITFMDSIEVHAYDPYFRQLRRILKCVNLDGNTLKCFEVLIVASLKYTF